MNYPEKITEVMQFLIFHPFSLVPQPFIIYHSSNTLKIFTTLNTYENVRFITRPSTPYNWVKKTEGILNLLKNLNFAFLVELWSAMGTICFYNLSQTPEPNQKSFEQLYMHCEGIPFFW